MTVLDASALLAYLFDEPGADVVESALADRPAIGCINLAETLTRLVDTGADVDAAWGTLESLPLEVVDTDAVLAVETARLRPSTRSAGLSLGDRACLALGALRREQVLTADRGWSALMVDVDVRQIR